MDENIYQPPKADIRSEEAAFEDEYGILKLASTGQRLTNMVIDWVSFYILAWAIGLFLGLTGLFVYVAGIPDLIWGMSVITLYYLPQEAIWGRTLGKRVSRTRAVSDDGGALSFGQALGRTLCRFIPFDALSFLFGAGFPRGWHDSIPGTRVVSLR